MIRLLRWFLSPTSWFLALLIGGAYLIDHARNDDETGQELRDTGPVYHIAFASDGANFASAGINDRVRVWMTQTGTMIGAVADRAVRTSALSFAPDGRTLALATVDPENRPWVIALWDVQTGERRAILLGHQDLITDLAFSADGQTLVSTSLDGTARIWEPRTGALRASTEPRNRPLYRAIHERGGTTILTAGDDGRVRRWDLRDGHALGVVLATPGPIRCMALAPDNATLATWEIGRFEVRLWETSSGRLRATCAGHDNFVQALAFAPDGDLLASASLDSSVRLWDTDSGRARGILRTANPGGVHGLAFAPDGTSLAVGLNGSRVTLWNIARADARDQAHGEIRLSRR